MPFLLNLFPIFKAALKNKYVQAALILLFGVLIGKYALTPSKTVETNSHVETNIATDATKNSSSDNTIVIDEEIKGADGTVTKRKTVKHFVNNTTETIKTNENTKADVHTKIVENLQPSLFAGYLMGVDEKSITSNTMLVGGRPFNLPITGLAGVRMNGDFKKFEEIQIGVLIPINL
jgi:hypothetical protein